MQRLRLRAIALATIFAFVAGCASSGVVPSTQSSSEYVTSVEIAATNANTAYDLVNRLRPSWLRRGGVSRMAGGRMASQITLVYLDGNRMGDAEALKSITAIGINSMQWLDASRAQTLLHEIGTEPIVGAIVLTTSTK